jgi:4-amino-4-deoxy-L-arabinose transferase-like glycosyltransferase
MRRFLLILAIITATGLLLRLIVGFELLAQFPPVSTPAPSTDMATYQQYAKEILSGEFDSSKGFYYQPFYYSILLPACYLISGGSAWSIVLVQALMGAACVWLIGITFAQLFGKRAGLIGAGLVALHRGLIFYTPFALIATVQSLWMTLLAYLAVRASKDKHWKWWALLGLVNGLAIITRGNAILFVPLLVALALHSHWRQWRPAAIAVALIVGLSWLPGLPYSIVNYRASGKWIGPSSAGAAVLALGNTPESPPGGREAGTGAGPMEYPAAYHDWTARDAATDADHRPMSQSILGWFRDEPLAYIELKARMLMLFWHRSEIPNNVAMQNPEGRCVPSRLLPLPIFTNFFILGTLGLAGMAFALWRRRRANLLFVLGLLHAYALSIVLFYILERFRIPIVPLLGGFAGFAIAHIWRQIRATRRGHKRPLLLLGAILLLSAVFVGYGYDAYRYGWERTVTRIARPNGVQLALLDRYEVKDHGPYSFGGWTPIPIAPQLQIRKTFIVADTAVANSATHLRLAVSGAQGTTVEIAIGGQTQTITLPIAGLNWLDFPLPDDAIQTSEDSWTIDISIAAAPDTFVIIDTQRDYTRTTFDLEFPPGELVIELIARPSK